MGIFRASTVATIFLTLSACGGAPAEPATPAAPPAPAAPEPAANAATPEAPKPAEPAPAAAAPAAPATPAHDVWADGMTKDQEAAFMKKNVVPEMEPVFKGYNAKRYDKFSCKTCHGPKYQVPKDFLPKLTFKDGKITSFTDKPEISKFMAEQVVPHMATAMGLKPFDMATHTGFGCNGCHTVQMK
jgi:pyruvate/2-oxoglutarate dehydrogenase complex dihydrolipoamide acyltransferase (E2) component